MTPDALAAAVRDAAARHAREDADARVAELTEGLGAPGGAPSDKAADLAVQALTDRRWFDLAATLGGALVSHGRATRLSRRRLAQALVESGRLAEAQAVLDALDATPGLPPGERAEVRGLIGRARKQAAVSGHALAGVWPADVLTDAVSAYLTVYHADPTAHLWHGINAVALLSLAAREGLAVPRLADPAALARDIADAVDTRSESDRTVWDAATRAEAAVALGDWTEAALHLDRYVRAPGVSAFTIGSTLRQFQEIWCLDVPGHPGRPLLTRLRARLLEMEQGSVTLVPAQVRTALGAEARADYEAVFGADTFVTLQNYLRGVECCRAVARIGRALSHGEGTGFVMRGADVSPRLGGETVLLTNAHVLDPTGDSGGIDPAGAVVSFQAHATVPPARAFGIRSVVWSSPRDALDVTVATLDADVPLTASYRIARHMPVRGSRVIVIGHPGGGTLAFSLADNELLDYEDDPGAIGRLHYRTPTEGGSSGSPVFTQDWRLIGLHHAGGEALPRLNGQPGTYQANEGIRFDRIRAALDAARLG